MSETIIIPDVHGRPFWRCAAMNPGKHRTVFLGDYLDPYPWEGIDPGEALSGLRHIIALKRAYPENVVLLLGNHDLGYLDPSVSDCRRDRLRECRIRSLLEESLDLFDIVHVEGNAGRPVLFSHAGVAEGWVRRHADVLGPVDAFQPETLNGLLHGSAQERQTLFSILAEASPYRGGPDDSGSPVWADVQEYLDGERLLDGYFHAFGHSLDENGPVRVGDAGVCLDCARPFMLRDGTVSGQGQ